MIVTSALDASRNWSSALSRFGFGVLILAAISSAGMFPKFLDISPVTTGEISLSYLPILVFWTMISMVIGALAIMLGSIGQSTKFGELAKAKRAFRVGNSGNALLAEMLRDSNARYELASGFMGVIYILFAVLGLGFMTGLTTHTAGLSTYSNLGGSGWLTIVYGGFGGLTSHLIRISATGGIEAIDKVLDQYIPELNGTP
jgi:hypothetical protein